MTSKTPTEFLKEPYARVLVPESEGGYYAEILEFPGCYASGDTPEETFRNLEDAALLWLESELEEGHEIPLPTSPEKFSGKFALRMPKSLHQQAARLAQREGTSLNQYIITAIAEKVGASDLLNRMAQQFMGILSPMVHASWAQKPTDVGGAVVTVQSGDLWFCGKSTVANTASNLGKEGAYITVTGEQKENTSITITGGQYVQR